MRILIFLLFASLSLSAKAGGIEFFDGSWAEAKDLAIQQDKIIFVDAYTSWCGPCKQMAKQVFTQDQVGAFYNENFICVKLDMEKDKDGPGFARDYSVRSYPTLLYINGAGEVVHRAVGGKRPDDFIQLGQLVVGKVDKSGDYEKMYEEGKRDPDFIYEYVKALNKAGKPSLKVANEYIHTQDDLGSDFNVKFLFEAATQADSRLFDLLVEQKNKAVALFGQEAFDQKVIAATNVTVDKAVEYESTDLLAEAKEKVGVISDKERIQLFHLRADKKYHLLTGDMKNYLKSAKKFVKEIAKDDAEHLAQLSLEVKKYLATDKKALKQGEEWAKMAYDLSPTWQRAHTYAEFLYVNNNPKKALAIAEHGQEMCLAASERPDLFTELIRKIKLDSPE